MRRVSRLTALVTAGVLLSAPAASAATSATGSTSVTADVANTLEATFPGNYAFGDLTAGTTNDSTEQVTTVKSNASWGVKLASDLADGRMKEWDTTLAAYVLLTPKVLTNALQWSLTSLGGSAQANGWTSVSSTSALVTGSQTATDDSGRTVGVKYRQAASYADQNAGANAYRIQLTYTAEQGF